MLEYSNGNPNRPKNIFFVPQTLSMKNIIERFFLIVLVMLLPTATKAQLWPATDSANLISHTFYTLSYNEKNEEADWVFYFLTPERTQNKVASRSDNFRPDPLVVTGSAELSDYRNSGFDRGHLCPASDMGFDSVAMSESFYMSNMCPQYPGFNRGVWKSLEEQVRVWSLQFDTLFVITGPVFYSNTYLHIGKNKVAVPDACFKVLLGKKDSTYSTIGFIIPNVNGLKNFWQFCVTIDEAEAKTGFDFFGSLDDNIEIPVEEKKGEFN
ncbi:MAG: DNA/RNA endonuclease [Bacteroidetes bacterium HGW-Bacteroidetes-6]|jgi:endonuclease G|nr:MAG: DNA/RNA endonuclease [Bacteroidetes bacterium HGW-Bacteroidetes-6]